MSKLIDESSIEILLQEMTIKEKIDLLTGETTFSTPAMPKYGIPSVRYFDGGTGVNVLQLVQEWMSRTEENEEKSSCSPNESGAGAMRFIKYIVCDGTLPDTFTQDEKQMIANLREKIRKIRPDGKEPTCFPSGILLGATWDPEMVYQVATAVGREACAYGIDVLLGSPNTNIHRNPRNGRLFESFSEDPYLASRMAPAFVKGVQDQGVVADVKHFAANNQETLRQGINELISKRALHEIYLPAFEAAVCEGHAYTIMSAYNSINGVRCAENHWLLTDLLKEKWGFEGQVISDWGAVVDQVAALKAGNDLDMPGPRGKEKVYQAVADGTLPLERIDDAVVRTLKVILKTPSFNGKKYPLIDSSYSEKIAYQAAAEGITLLKNKNVLPLKIGEKVSLFGRLTDRFMESGSGSAEVDTTKTTHLPTELSRFTRNIECGIICDSTETVIITAGVSGQEGSDRPDMRLDTEDEIMLSETLQRAKKMGKKTVVLLNISGPVELKEYMQDIDALLCLYFPGTEGAKATADILFGEVCPSGKLPLTFPVAYRDTPSAINFPGEHGVVNYGEGIFVGYRYYDYKGIEPLFPFGYGLSYSTFEMTGMEISAEQYEYVSEEPLRVFITIKNTGGRKASEVIQLYIHARHATLQKPEKELKGFSKVCLSPEESEKVEIDLFPKSFASYDEDLSAWTVEPGVYDILAGFSSRDICYKKQIVIIGKNPYGRSLRTQIWKIAEDEEAMMICRDVLGEDFNEEKFKGSAIYFGNTGLGDYLERSVSEERQNRLEWKVRRRMLEERLEEERT